MKNYYELLGVTPAASPQEIKRAFRREIARYHPDKVQHLGEELQELAAVRAAELTTAYRVLIDATRRAEYDAALRAASATGAAVAGEEARRRTVWPPDQEDRDLSADAGPPPVRRARDARHTYVRRAALEHFAAAVEAALGELEPLPARGFDVGFRTRGRRGLFRSEDALGVCAVVLPAVDGEAVQMTWTLAARVGPLDLNLCVFLMSEQLAPADDLAAAVARLRRRTRVARSLVVVPVDVRDWRALVPTDAPPAVKRILAALRAHG